MLSRQISRRPNLGPAPLTFGQEQMWLIDRASPGTTAWNIVEAVRLTGSLDIDALQKAIDALYARHECLRTLCQDTLDGPRAILLPAGPHPILHVDLRTLNAQARSAAARELVNEQQARPFALGEDVPLRVVLARMADDDHILCIATHHIAFDGWSRKILVRDLSALYAAFLRNQTALLPSLPIQYADYAAWERGAQHQAEQVEKLAFWREQLADAPDALELPTNQARSLVTAYDAGCSVIVLPPELVESIALYARKHKATLYLTLLATYVAVLARYSGQDDILVGSPIAGRTQPETEDLIGFFINTLVLRARVEDDPTFPALLARVRETFFDSYERQDVPVEQIVIELQKDRRHVPTPLFNAILNMGDAGTASYAFPGIAAEPIERERFSTKFDFTLTGTLGPAGLELTLKYRADLFAAHAADGFLAHFRRLLEAGIADPSAPISTLPLVSTGERNALVAAMPQPLESGLHSVLERFAEAVLAEPDAPALVCGQDRRTYAELDASAKRVKRQLDARRAGRGALVGLALDRSGDAIAAILGIWQAGGAYVPLAPDLPPARLAAIAQQCGLRFVITDAPQSAKMSAAGLEVVVIDRDDEAAVTTELESMNAGAGELAYVIFTSGSTGVPKGVAVTHRNLAGYVDAIEQRLEIGPADRWRFASVSSLAADLGNTTVFAALATGGTLHIVPVETATDPDSFARWAATEPVDVLKITPSHLAALLGGGSGNPLPRRWLVLGAEACPTALVRRVQSLSACAILNHYGPTETTVGACTYRVAEHFADADERSTVPIGTPLAGVRCYVLDRHGEPVPAGIAGELFVGGRGVSAGYIGRPDLTRDRFIPDPFTPEHGALMYRTGDRVRRLPGGELEFLGRNDDQVKIRGYRVELGEIASVLSTHPDVAQSVAALRSNGAGEPRLVAYAVLHSDRPATTGQLLREWLAGRLPDHMVPTGISILDRLPLKSNGKLDHGALKDLDEPPASSENFQAPRTATERAIAAVWQEFLNVDRVAVNADFFALGFHSILAIRAVARLGRIFGIRLQIRTFFEAKTIEGLALAIDAQLRAATQREFERNLALIESLADVDVLALLAQTSSGNAR